MCEINNILRELQKPRKDGLEKFLDHLHQKYGVLFHGSIEKINSGKLVSKKGAIFASDKSIIAIMRSLYSNRGVNLEYPYFINSRNPLVLKIHAKPGGKFMKKDKGFIYILHPHGFENDPKGSWQYIKKAYEVDYIGVIETKDDDFNYPVEIYNDFNCEIM